MVSKGTVDISGSLLMSRDAEIIDPSAASRSNRDCAYLCTRVCVCTSVQEKAGCVKQNFQYQSYLLLKAVTVQTDVLTVEMSSGCSETSIHLCINRRLHAYGHVTCVERVTRKEAI